MAEVCAIVLAAGLSGRMGEANKLFEEIQGKAIIDHSIESISKSKVSELIIVSSEISNERIRIKYGARFRMIDNPDYKTGMTSSIKAGVKSLEKDIDGYMICLADQPLIKTETFDKLIDSFTLKFKEDKACIIQPIYEGKKGNPVIFSSSFREAILNHTEPEGCREIVKLNLSHLELVEVSDPGIHLDIDTREALESLYR